MATQQLIPATNSRVIKVFGDSVWRAKRATWAALGTAAATDRNRRRKTIESGNIVHRQKIPSPTYVARHPAVV